MLIRDLIKRGNQLMNSNSKKLIEIEDKINKKIESKGDYFSEPVRAYIIFQDEEGYQRACHMEKQTVCCKTRTEVEWHGKPLYFKAAPEPSNIMWENQFWPKSIKYFRITINLLIIVLMLFLQVTFMFIINKKSVQMQSHYPLVDCNDVKSVFADDLQKFAVIQWDDINHGINLDQRGAHQCFCD